MTSHELAAILLSGPNLEVHYAYPAGDYWRTTLAPSVDQVATGLVQTSSYHKMDILVTDEEGEKEEQHREVIVLR